MKKTGDVFWKVMIAPRGTNDWEFTDCVYRHRKHAEDDKELSDLAAEPGFKRKVVKAELYVK